MGLCPGADPGILSWGGQYEDKKLIGVPHMKNLARPRLEWAEPGCRTLTRGHATIQKALIFPHKTIINQTRLHPFQIFQTFFFTRTVSTAQ